jgi:hypothetical protein
MFWDSNVEDIVLLKREVTLWDKIDACKNIWSGILRIKVKKRQ